MYYLMIILLNICARIFPRTHKNSSILKLFKVATFSRHSDESQNLTDDFCQSNNENESFNCVEKLTCSILNARKMNNQETHNNFAKFWIWWKNNWGKKYPKMDFINLWNLEGIFYPLLLNFASKWFVLLPVTAMQLFKNESKYASYVPVLSYSHSSVSFLL